MRWPTRNACTGIASSPNDIWHAGFDPDDGHAALPGHRGDRPFVLLWQRRNRPSGAPSPLRALRARTAGRQTPCRLQRSRPSSGVIARDMHGHVNPACRRSASERVLSRCSGVPASTLTAQVPQVPVRHAEGAAMPAACIAASGVTPSPEWRFGDGGEARTVRLRPCLTTTSNDAAIAAALGGFELTRLLSYQVAGHLQDGALTAVLTAFEPAPVPVCTWSTGKAATRRRRCVRSMTRRSPPCGRMHRCGDDNVRCGAPAAPRRVELETAGVRCRAPTTPIDFCATRHRTRPWFQARRSLGER